MDYARDGRKGSVTLSSSGEIPHPRPCESGERSRKDGFFKQETGQRPNSSHVLFRLQDQAEFCSLLAIRLFEAGRPKKAEGRRAG